MLTEAGRRRPDPSAGIRASHGGMCTGSRAAAWAGEPGNLGSGPDAFSHQQGCGPTTSGRRGSHEVTEGAKGLSEQRARLREGPPGHE